MHVERCQQRPGLLPGLDAGQLALRQSEGNLDRPHFGDGDQRRGGAVGTADHVARLKQDRSGLAVHRRANLRIPQIKPSHIHCCLVGCNVCGDHVGIGIGQIALLRGDRALLAQGGVALFVAQRVLQLRLVAAVYGLGLGQRRLEGSGINLEQ